LKNPFYYGDFVYWGELHEGRHEPLISKALWDKVQKVIERRAYKMSPASTPAEYCGLMKCPCRMSITATTKTRTQINGNFHSWTYYHCSRKSRSVRCVESPVREFLLVPHLSALLSRYSLPTEAISWLRDKISSVSEAESGKNRSVSENLRVQINDFDIKQKLLLDSYLDQDIDRPTFVEKKNEIASAKRDLGESLARVERNANCWVEPMRKWLDRVERICSVIEDSDHLEIKRLLLEIFGSNLCLINKNVVAKGDGNFNSPRENIWHALCAANKKWTAQPSQISKNSELECLFNLARTYFTTQDE
jgi:hypothetical protein